MAAQQRTDRAGAGRLLSLLKDAHLHGGGKRPAPWAVRNFRISRRGCRHDTRPAATFCTATHGGWRCQGYVRHDHETFSYEPQTLNFTGCFVSSSLAQRAVPSVDDCSRTAPSPAPLRAGWNASESGAGFDRNHRLVCVGLAGWHPSEYAQYPTQALQFAFEPCRGVRFQMVPEQYQGSA